jgi:hypothetical protein
MAIKGAWTKEVSPDRFSPCSPKERRPATPTLSFVLTSYGSLSDRAIPQEDDTVVELVGKLGAKKWSQIASHLEGRIGKQCRERCD